MANLQARYSAMSDEDLQKELAFITAILPGGSEEARAKYLELTYGNFQKNDLNSNETIQPGQEFEGLVNTLFERYNVEKSEENYKKYFSEIDADGDGNITFKEFVDYVDSLGTNYGIPAIQAEIAKRQAQ